MNAQGYPNEAHDFFVFNPNNQVWNGSAFVAWNPANFVSYRVPATELAGSGGDFSAPDVLGGTRFVLRLRAATLEDSVPVDTGIIAGTGSLTAEQNAALLNIEDDVNSIRGHYDAVLEPGEEATVIPAPSSPAKAVVRVCTADFTGVPLANTKVTLTLVDTKTPVIGDIIRNTRFVEGMTNKLGEVDLEVYSDVTLIASKLKPTYKLTFPGVELKIRVPPQGGLASRLLDPLG